MDRKLSITDLDLKGKRVLVRVDFNVPIENGKITDDTRIRASLPTIQYILDHGGSVILMSHLGRPDGKYNKEFTLAPCAKRLSELIKMPVKMAPDCVGPEVEKMAANLKPGEILLLENLRFHKGEENPGADPNFAKSLAKLGDIYINDAFGTAHRAHSSTTIIANYFPDRAAAGFLLENEIKFLGNLLIQPNRPFCAILGGSKISTKLKVIQALKDKADIILIGGAMANTFLKAQGIAIGESMYEKDFLNVANALIQSGKAKASIFLPVDLVVAKEAVENAKTKIVSIKEGVPPEYKIFDVGPKTVELFRKEMQKAQTILWNGPLGVFECPPFDHATMEIANTLAHLNASTIVAGGDSIAAIEKSGVANKITHISTGGGAALEYLELGTLPGIEALSNNEMVKKK